MLRGSPLGRGVHRIPELAQLETLMALDRAYNEKRGFIRMRIDAPVQVEAGASRFTARCKDLSGSGMLVAAAQPLEVGQEVNLTIDQEGGNRLPFRATASVARCEAQPGSDYIIGLSITAIHE